MAKKKYYAVAVGRQPGIYTQWFGNAGAQAQVIGFWGARYKGFTPTRTDPQMMVMKRFVLKLPQTRFQDEDTKRQLLLHWGKVFLFRDDTY